MTLSLLLTLAACSAPLSSGASPAASAARTSANALPAGPVAPAIESATWINTEPLAWDSLRGQVVLVEFWTYSCINCQNVVPLMKSLHADYADRGFTLLSVHSPEYLYEKELANVKDAVAKAGITYPVAIDNDFANWNRYRNRYWPARYLVDKRGILRLTTIGEGGDAETRQWIETLLAEQDN